MKKGVDISEMNGAVDFGALGRAGVEFVLIRCGYGSDYPHQDDTRFEENVGKALAAGIPWGVYLYSYAQSSGMARSEAQHVLRLLKGRKPPYGVWLDVEDASQEGCDLPGVCEVFCQALEAQGLYVGVYSSLSWWRGKLHDSRLNKYDKWVAQWAPQCDYGGGHGLWQFTDHWVIGGRAFDGDVAYRDFPALTGGKEQDGMSYDDFKAMMARYCREQGAKAVSTWAAPAVEAARAQGLMQGDEDGRFRPHSWVTRQELAQVLCNYSKDRA